MHNYIDNIKIMREVYLLVLMLVLSCSMTNSM